jgi:hypothetical protein
MATTKTPVVPGTVNCPTCGRAGYKPAKKKSFLVAIEGTDMNPLRYSAFRHSAAAEEFIKEWDAKHDKQILAGKSVRLRVWIIGESEKPQFFDARGAEIASHRTYLITSEVKA